MNYLHKGHVRNLLRLLCLMLNVALCLSSSASLANSMPKTTPSTLVANVSVRNFAYTIGDVVKMRVKIPNISANAIESKSIPLPGRVNYWLDIRHIKITQASHDVILDIEWQLFSTVETAQLLTLPAITLRLMNQPTSILIPSTPIYFSPVLPKSLPAQLTGFEDIPPSLENTENAAVIFFVCSFLTFLYVLLFLWLHDLIPWIPFRRGPLLKLYHQLRKLPPNQTIQFEHIELIHKTLQDVAKCTLMPHQLNTLYVKAPYLSEYQKQILQFHDATWPRLFNESIHYSICNQDVLAWIKKASKAERLFMLKHPRR